MATQAQIKPENKNALDREGTLDAPTRTVIGWQGMRCLLPPEWNVAGFSMDRDNGYLRVDAPGSGSMTVQLRWFNAAKPAKTQASLYYVLAPRFRKLLKRPEPEIPAPDLKANLDKLFKENAKQARKGKAAFDSSVKPERVEGEQDERAAMNFSWSGQGRGQGKIWYCKTCHRVVIAQVVGLNKDQAAMQTVASQLFASLQCHATDGYDRWALYDFQMDVPEDFRLEAQKLLSGYLHLTFGRGGEKIVLDRWGLANMTRKKFTLDAWFANNALVKVQNLAQTETRSALGHAVSHYAGGLSLAGRMRVLRESKASLRRFPSQYEGGVWECEAENKIYALQVVHNAKTRGLWAEVLARCLCH